MYVGFRAEGVCDEVDSFWEDRNQGSENSGVFQSQEFGLNTNVTEMILISLWIKN